MLWQRPRRVAAAELAAQSIASGLEQDGLTLVSDVKLAYAEYALAQDRIALAERALTELNAIATLMDSRFQAGDISQLEARTAAIDAARARQDVERARLDAALRANEFRARLGLALEADGDATRADRRRLVHDVRRHADAARRRPGVAPRCARGRTGDRSGGRASRLGALSRVAR